MSKKEKQEQQNEPEIEIENPETEVIEDDWKDKYIRILADFENFKKRTAKEMTSSFSNGVTVVAEELLPIMDNFDRAVLALDESNDKALSDGIKLIYKQFKDTFEKIGIKEIKAVGEKFDPNLHNAVMHTDDENFGENEVVEEFMKGYTLKDKVIRHSMVKVAN